jgi:Nuclease-related domain
MHCVECPADRAAEPPPAIEAGTAGRSARAEHDRRAAKRDARIEARWGSGRVGRFVKAVTSEPQSTRAWAIGAWGEEKLAEALAGIDGLRVLHDRRVPGTRGNIDHIAIASAGVFVVDAKAYEGLIEIRNYGWFFRPDWRLTVGRRDKSKLARAMGWQVDAVRAALEAAGIDPRPPITPVLCFVDGRWPLFRPPNEFEGVRLESERSIGDLFTAAAELDSDGIERVARALATALPAK